MHNELAILIKRMLNLAIIDVSSKLVWIIIYRIVCAFIWLYFRLVRISAFEIKKEAIIAIWLINGNIKAGEDNFTDDPTNKENQAQNRKSFLNVKHPCFE